MRSVQHDNRIKNYQINPITENNNLNRDCSCIMDYLQKQPIFKNFYDSKKKFLLMDK